MRYCRVFQHYMNSFEEETQAQRVNRLVVESARAQNLDVTQAMLVRADIGTHLHDQELWYERRAVALRASRSRNARIPRCARLPRRRKQTSVTPVLSCIARSPAPLLILGRRMIHRNIRRVVRAICATCATRSTITSTRRFRISPTRSSSSRSA